MSSTRAGKNRVIVGPEQELFHRKFVVRDVNWIRPVADGEAVEAHVKIRHNHPGAPAQSKRTEPTRLRSPSTNLNAPSLPGRRQFSTMATKWWVADGLIVFSNKLGDRCGVSVLCLRRKAA